MAAGSFGDTAAAAAAAATYQTHFPTNRSTRGVGDTLDAYDALVQEDATVTRCRYVVLVAAFILNLVTPLVVLPFAVRGGPQQLRQPSPRCWRPTSRTGDSTGWLVCRHCAPPRERTTHCAPELVDDAAFCHAASKVSVCLAPRIDVIMILYQTSPAAH